MTDRKLLELIAGQVSKLTTQFDTLTTQVGTLTTQVGTLTTQVDTITTQVDTITTQVDTLTKDVDEMKATMATKQELAEIKAIVVKIENDHGQKLGALFDGYSLLSEKLDRIEDEVSKHEEIILRRI